MTKMGRPATDKRERLIAAAVVQFHHKGIDRSSLADVANAAGVPPGNSYYYFRSKDELTRSVVEQWDQHLSKCFAGLDSLPDPAVRVSAFLDGTLDRRSGYVAYGCPLNGINYDLRRRQDSTAGVGSRLYEMQLDWLRSQFGQLGMSNDKGDTWARLFLSSIQGSLLLAHATGDPQYIDRTIFQLKDWLTTWLT